MRCFLLGLLSLVFSSLGHAPEVRPAYLQLTEVAEGATQYHVLWKQPIVQNRRLPIDPVFTEDCAM